MLTDGHVYASAVRPAAAPLLRLSWHHFVVIVAVCSALAAAVGIALAPDLGDRYARRAVKEFEREFGFETGAIVVSNAGGAYPTWGITTVTPDGRFERLGFRPGDVPFEHHGHAASSLYYAVREASQGRSAEIDVYNARDVGSGPAALRRIVVSPPR